EPQPSSRPTVCYRIQCRARSAGGGKPQQGFIRGHHLGTAAPSCTRTSVESALDGVGRKRIPESYSNADEFAAAHRGMDMVLVDPKLACKLVCAQRPVPMFRWTKVAEPAEQGCDGTVGPARVASIRWYLAPIELSHDCRRSTYPIGDQHINQRAELGGEAFAPLAGRAWPYDAIEAWLFALQHFEYGFWAPAPTTRGRHPETGKLQHQLW